MRFQQLKLWMPLFSNRKNVANPRKERVLSIQECSTSAGKIPAATFFSLLINDLDNIYLVIIVHLRYYL